MLHIRKEQMDIFKAAMLASFQQRAYIHLQKCWPQKCRAMGRDAVMASIPEAVRRAAEYGITSKRNIIIYLDVTYALCPNFDADPRFPCAHQILTDSALPPKRKMQKLWNRTKELLKSPNV